eukprot:3949671-Pleurochrysis_carterae.AAC.2
MLTTSNSIKNSGSGPALGLGLAAVLCAGLSHANSCPYLALASEYVEKYGQAAAPSTQDDEESMSCSDDDDDD